MILVESRVLPEITIPKNLVFQEPKDPYLCEWADWYYLVIMAYWLQGKSKEARTLVEEKVSSVLVNEGGAISTKPVEVLRKGFLLPKDNHPNWSENRSTKTGASTALILNGEHQGMIVIPSGIRYSVGRMLNPEQAYNAFYSLKATSKPGNPQLEYIEVQKTVLDKALVAAGSLTKLYNSVSATLAGVKNS